jgi:hypothetical protein
MPGPVSDSYDPEFGTGENASRVYEAVAAMRQQITGIIGSDMPKDIVKVIKDKPGPSFSATFSEREWRIMRFAINRALESM